MINSPALERNETKPPSLFSEQQRVLGDGHIGTQPCIRRDGYGTARIHRMARGGPDVVL